MGFVPGRFGKHTFHDLISNTHFRRIPHAPILSEAATPNATHRGRCAIYKGKITIIFDENGTSTQYARALLSLCQGRTARLDNIDLHLSNTQITRSLRHPSIGWTGCVYAWIPSRLKLC